MWRKVGSLLFVSALAGCVSVDGGPESGGPRPHWGRSFGPPSVPGVEGPYGTPVGMAAPYNTAPPGSQAAAARMMNNSVPLNMVQMNPGGVLTPNGVPFLPNGGMPGGAGSPRTPTGPGMGMPGMGMPGMGMPGMGMPGMGMPGMGMPMPPGGNIKQASFMTGMPEPGVVPANVPPGGNPPPPGGVMPAQFASTSAMGPMFPAQRTQVRFSTNPAGVMKIHWYTQGKDGKPSYSIYPLETPGSYNFAQAAIYRLKLTHIPGHPGLELYPTLEVVPTGPKTSEFLAHNSVPLVFTEADFKQVVDRNYIVKVIYLPDPQFQEGAGAGPDEIDSRRLEPGQDPIQEALRRGSILLVVRIGNIDQEVPNTPSMVSAPPGMKNPPLLAPPGVPGGVQVPYFGGPMLPGLPMPGPVVTNPTPQPGPTGNEMERKKPGVLPPLPSEQANPGKPVLPFDDLPAPKPVAPLPNKDGKGLDAFPPLPPLNLDLPREEAKEVAPTPLEPKKDAFIPPAPVDGKAPTLPKKEASVEPTPIPAPVVPAPRPAEPKVSDLTPTLPAIPTPTLPQLFGRDKVNVPGGAPSLPTLPEFLTGPDTMPIPTLPGLQK